MSAPVKGTDFSAVCAELGDHQACMLPGCACSCHAALVPVVNEVAEAAAKAMNLEAGRQRGLTLEDDWKTITEQERGGWRLVAHSVLALPEFRAAFEAQAKLKALLAGEGDLPEGWTEEWRWSVGVDHGSWRRSREVTVASATACRISGYVVERHLVSPAVRVEEGGEL